jgi:hypothetical protein
MDKALQHRVVGTTHLIGGFFNAEGLRPPLAKRLPQFASDPTQQRGVAGHSIGLVTLRLLAPAFR